MANDKTDLEKAAASGGKARAASLTPERRREVALLGAASRWGVGKTPRATHEGELHLGDLVIPCAVLDDGRRVLSQRSVGKALGRGYGGKDWRTAAAEGGDAGQLPFFLVAANLKPFISDELVVLASRPIKYRRRQGGLEGFGIEAGLLPQFCDIWLKAREAGALRTQQRAIAQKAEILVRGLAHVGITALVDEATGYQDDRTKRELAKILEAYVVKELQPWVGRFPVDFFRQVYRLHGWEYKEGNTKRTPQVGKLINKLIYEQLPPPVLPKLQQLNPSDEKYQRRHKHFQFLTEETGIAHLDKQLAVVTSLMKVAKTKDQFLAMFSTVFPTKGQQLKLPDHDEADLNDID